MILADAQRIAESLKRELAPFCLRIEIAGSIRRKKPVVGDIEIVCIRREVLRPDALFGETMYDPDFILHVERYPAMKGTPAGRYTQRLVHAHPEPIKLDLFMVHSDNWGLQLAIRTGSAEYSHRVLASGWVRNGYTSEGGMLRRAGREGVETIPVLEEEDLFRLAGVPWVEPEKRNL